MGYIIKFGGSLLFQENLDVKENTLKKLATIILSAQNVEGVVCGGGKIARTYIHAGRALGFTEERLDTLGILVSRINAQLLIYLLGNRAFPHPITSVEEVKRVHTDKKILVAGGFVPKQSTTTVAMQIGEILSSDLIILTDVDGIYDKDPKQHRDAKKFDQMNYEELEYLLDKRQGQEQTAGKYQIFDLLSLQILRRSNISVRFINGSKLKYLEDLLTSDFQNSNIGTIITK
jgi:uridylate kinase